MLRDQNDNPPWDVLPQTFGRLFTTRWVGDGARQGLSITPGIVQDHGGWMDVEIAAGQGTCFRVILPISPE
jgi:signal transduction histidine kinase